MDAQLPYFAKHLPKRGSHFPECHRRKHADTIEEINKDAEERMHPTHQSVLGSALLETTVAFEVAHFHHFMVEPLRRAPALRVIERHLSFGKAKLIHHKITKGLPRFHQMHVGKPSPHFLKVKLTMISMQGHGHIRDLPPSHT